LAKSISKAFTYIFKDSDWKYKFFLATMISIPITLSTYASMNFKNMQLFDMSKIKQLASMSSLAQMGSVPDYDDYLSAPPPPNPADVASLSSLSHVIILSIALSIIASIASLILVGYYCKCTQNVINSSDDKKVDVLPSWEKDFGLYSKIGILFSYGSFIAFALPIIALVLIFLTNQGHLLTLGLPCVLWILFIVFAFCAMCALFCTDLQPSSFLAYRKTIRLMTHNLPNYLAILGTIIGLCVLSGALFMVFGHTPVFVVLFSAIQTYFSFVFAYLLGAIFQTHPVKLFS